MRNIFLISVLIFSSSIVFSQDSSCIETYLKLDEIHKILLNDKIKNFDKLNKEIKQLKKALGDCKLSTKKTELESLSDLNDSLMQNNNHLSKRAALLSNNNNELRKQNNSSNKLNKKAKKDIEKEIYIVENYRGTIDPDLITHIIERANIYGVNVKNLKVIQSLNKLIKKSESLLNVAYNRDENNNQILKITTSTKNIYLNLPWHKERLDNLSYLLNSYRKVNNKLFNFLLDINDYGEIDENIMDLINDELIFYFNYPFLRSELTIKSKRIEYVSKISKM